MDVLKEIFTAFNSRIRSPIMGSIIIVFIALNWKPIFYVLFSGEVVENRFQFFDANTDNYTLFWYPLLIGIFLAVISPWISLLGGWVAQYPISKHKKLELSNEHDLLIEKEKLEKQRASLLKTKEEELISQAKRDEEIKAIDDEEVREDLQNQIDELREKSQYFFSANNNDSDNQTQPDFDKIQLSPTAVELLTLTAFSEQHSFRIHMFDETLPWLSQFNSAYATIGDRRIPSKGQSSIQRSAQELVNNGLAINVSNDEYYVTPKGQKFAHYIKGL